MKHCNRIKALSDKPTPSTALSGEKLIPFPLKPGARQECSHASLLLDTVLKIFNRRQEKDIKWTQTGKGKYPYL